MIGALRLPALFALVSLALSAQSQGCSNSTYSNRTNSSGCTNGRLWTANSTIGMPVNTTSGRTVGHANLMYPYVSEYLGIPFAEPPLGNLRFAPPKPYSGRKEIVAAEQPTSCIQSAKSSMNASWALDFRNLIAAGSSKTLRMGEDCLYLNIWTKFPSPGAFLKPVMIWIYGGGFHTGAISDNSEQGGIYAEEQDVVFVSFNYRLNYFGFPGAPNITQNAALLDQRLAVEWIRDNIAGFGGDPSRMIIFGHSAGGASVDLYNYAWAKDPIVYGSVPMSGNALSFGNRYANTTAAAWYLVSEAVGCGNSSTSSDDTILACVRNKNATELFQASLKANTAVTKTLPEATQEYAGVTGIFGPTIDNFTVFENYTLLGEMGKFAQIPMLVGNNDDEGCFFAMRGQIPVSEEDELTAVIFTCPSYYTALYRAKVGLSTWKYRYFGAYPNLYAELCPGRPWHGQEIYVSFNSSGLSKESITPLEANMGWTFREAWAAFAHDPHSGLSQSQGWPMLNSDEGDVVVLGLNETLITVQNAAVWNEPCQTEFVSGGLNF